MKLMIVIMSIVMIVPVAINSLMVVEKDDWFGLVKCILVILLALLVVVVLVVVYSRLNYDPVKVAKATEKVEEEKKVTEEEDDDRP
jgi:uncharacterized protein YpmS